MFYQGQSVAGTARHFRDVQWINGPRPVFSNSQRVTAIVEEVSDFIFRLLFLFIKILQDKIRYPLVTLRNTTRRMIPREAIYYDNPVAIIMERNR